MNTPSARLAAVVPFVVTFIAMLCVGCGSDSSPPGDDGGVTQCTTHTQCDDGLFCNGAEQCMPSSAAADAEGCVPGAAACVANVACDETADSCGTVCTNGDMDGDGHDAVACGGDDCDDTDADRFPGNTETCDDGAGGQHDEDCDPATFGTTDGDGDGEVASSCCNMGSSGPNCGTDCDDTTIRRRSGQVEFCDSADNDCDGRIDEQTQDVPWYPDTDGDGFGTGTAVISCTPVAGHSLASTDCDDASAQEHPAQLDICDLSDNNCNVTIDELPICDVVQLVGVAGATLTSTATGGGTIRVQIPAGALSSSTPVAIGEIHPRTLPGLATGESFVGRPVAISPYGQAFSVPVNVTLPAAGQNLAVLRLSDEDDTTWEVVEATFTVGQALFEAESGGVYAVATKTCTAAPETCDSADNDCDWLVDEEDVCATGVVTTRDEFVAALTQLAVAEWVACYSTTTVPASFDHSDIDGWIADTLSRDQLAAGYLALDLERANHVLQVLRAWPDCATDLDWLLEVVFLSVIRGGYLDEGISQTELSGVGDDCASTRNCELGLHCVNPTDATPCRGMCADVPGQALGQPCRAHADCALTSTNNMLVLCAPNGVGVDVCQEQSAPTPLLSGETISTDGDMYHVDWENEFIPPGCGAGAELVEDDVVLVEGRVLHFYRCQPFIPVGAVCDPFSGDDCGNFASCNPTTASRALYRCYADTYGAAGAVCSIDWEEEVGRGSRECAHGYACDETTARCVVPECKSDDDCQSGFRCAADECEPWLQVGDPCDSEGACLTYLCDVNGTSTCIAPAVVFDAGGAEVCDGEDNDCDGHFDEALPDLTVYYDDLDQDGYYGAGAMPVLACGPDSRTSNQPGDCEPNDRWVHPGAAEEPGNGKDDDCNPATTDQGFCGDGWCVYTEDTATCGQDCTFCGDSWCDPPFETMQSCPDDCG